MTVSELKQRLEMLEEIGKGDYQILLIPDNREYLLLVRILVDDECQDVELD